MNPLKTLALKLTLKRMNERTDGPTDRWTPAAPPNLVVEPKDGDLVSGQSTVIECQASGQPRPTISWARARGK